MNRLPLIFGTQPDLSAIDEDVDSILERTPCRRLQLFCPIHYEPNYAYPLLVWLHGTDADELQLLRIMPWISLRNYVAVAPRAPWACPYTVGYRWHDSLGQGTEIQDVVDMAVEMAQRRFHIHPERIFLAGYQAGGTLALRLALDQPERFRAAASINGPFPRDGAPLLQLSRVQKLPLWIAQGASSTAYPSAQLCEDLKLFHTAAMTVMVRQYSCGEEIHARMLSDLNAWLMEHVTGQPSA